MFSTFCCILLFITSQVPLSIQQSNNDKSVWQNRPESEKRTDGTNHRNHLNGAIKSVHSKFKDDPSLSTSQWSSSNQFKLNTDRNRYWLDSYTQRTPERIPHVRQKIYSRKHHNQHHLKNRQSYRKILSKKSDPVNIPDSTNSRRFSSNYHMRNTSPNLRYPFQNPRTSYYNTNFQTRDWPRERYPTQYRGPSQPVETLPRPARLNVQAQQWKPLTSTPKKEDKRPNIILILADDQDIELGSLNYMPKLMKLMGKEGSHFTNAYTSTPMCCPSRSSMLTGMYIHNHEVYTNNDNCSSTQWQNTHEKRTFATYLNDAGYRTGYFGKYLNKYKGAHVPSGWREWAGLIMNSRFYNYTINRNNRKQKYGFRYPQDYYPHVITNDGLHFLRTTLRMDPSPPIMMTLSYPGPHGPEDSAPEHSHKFFNASDHHTPSYNYAPNPDKQWILQFTDRMEDIHLKFTDLLMTKRLQTLQTIDEAVEKIVNELKIHGILNNTYIFYTSDHGYHLGQFGLAKGKSFPFEFDIKVPFLVRGPGITPGSQINKIALNIDLAPTFLDIAGVTPPSHMDGRSLLPLLKSKEKREGVKWRDSFLVESSGRHREEGILEMKEQKKWMRENELISSVNQSNIENNAPSLSSFYTSKHERLEEVCQQQQFQGPCSATQKWQCVHDGRRWRLQKCRSKLSKRRRNCVCEPDLGMGYVFKISSNERRKQRSFLKKHVNKDIRSFDPKFLKSYETVDSAASELNSQLHKKKYSKWSSPSSARQKRNAAPSTEEKTPDEVNVSEISNFVEEEELKDINDLIDELSNELLYLESVRVSTNTNDNITTMVDCSDAMVEKNCDHQYLSFESWKLKKSAMVKKIKLLKQQLQLTKNIWQHLQPESPVFSGDDKILNEFDVNVDDFETSGDGTDINQQIYDNFYLNMTNEVDITSNNDWNFTDGLQPTQVNNQQIQHPDIVYGQIHNFSKKSILDSKNSLRGRTVKFNTVITDGDESHSTDHTKIEKEIRTDKPPHKYYPSSRNYQSKYSLSVSDIRSRNPNKQKLRIKNKKYNNNGQLYPIMLPSLTTGENGEENENDGPPQPICWCDHRTATKFSHQAEVMKRRLERQKIKDERLRKRIEKKRKKSRQQIMSECNFTKLNCYTHDNDHWRTPPLWTDGKFCFCMNSANNTYWCLRTINETENYLFCEFITGLITYYDLNIDPYQLRNVAFTLSNDQLIKLHQRLQQLRVCSGTDNCDGIETSTKTVSTTVKPDSSELSSVNNIYSSVNGNTIKKTKKDKEEKVKNRDEKRQSRREKKKIRKLKKQEEAFLDAAIIDFIPSTRRKKIRVPRKSRYSKETKRSRKERRERRKKLKERNSKNI